MRFVHILTILLTVVLPSACKTVAESAVDLRWSSGDRLPAAPEIGNQPGLAGAVIGISNDHLIVAGGANFPGGLPWRGGKRIYHDRIYAAKKGKDGDLQWTISDERLDIPMAYAANVPYRDGFISLGGENDEGLLRSVRLWRWDAETASLRAEKLPDLPDASTNASAVVLDETLFFIGGENRERAFREVWKLELKNQEKGWQAATPLPRAMSHTVAVAPAEGSKAFFVAGGRARQPDGVSELYHSLLQYDTEKETWTEKAKIMDGTAHLPALSAAMAVGYQGTIYLMGGDDGSIFHQIETFASRAKNAGSEAERSEWQAKQFALAENHPGFSRQVYAYNVANDQWTRLKPLPYAPVTSTAVIWNHEIFIPSGEIHPGIRTDDILRAPLNPLTK